MENKFYTVEEVASILHYTDRRVRQWLKAGKLNGLKVPEGRKWLIPVDALEEFLKDKRYRPFLGPLVDGYIVMDSMPSDEFHEWLIANGYEAYALEEGSLVFIRTLHQL